VRKGSSANIWRVRHAIRAVVRNLFRWGNGFPTLDDLGISKKLSHRAQRLAAIPTKDFDWYLTAAEQELEITTRLLLHYSERRQATAKNRIVEGRIDDLVDFEPGVFQRQ
jgi:hypothetical protein